MIDQLKARHANNLLDLLDKAGLTAKLDTMEDFTLFAPSEQAISELPRAVLEELAEDREGLEEILLHHVVREHSGSLAELQDNTEMETVGGSAVRVNRQGHGRAMVQCSRILRPDEKVCGGRLHTIDRVLTPPRGDVLQALQVRYSQASLSLVQLIHYCALIGGELHSDEIFSPPGSPPRSSGSSPAGRRQPGRGI